MSQESQSYVVEAGGVIPSFISEAESIDNQGRPINSRLEQQPPQIQNIIHQSQQQNPPQNSQIRRGIVKKEGKSNRNTQSQQNQEQPFKREVKHDDQGSNQLERQPVIAQNQFSQQVQDKPKQRRVAKKVQKGKEQEEQPQQRQKSQERNNQIQPEQKQQTVIPPIPIKEEIQQPQSDKKKKKFNIFKKIRKMQGLSKLLIRKVPFMRMVRRTAQIICDENKLDTPRFTYEAIVALQTVMEKTMMSIFEDANMITANANRTTLFGKDLNVLRKIRNAPWDFI
ncbi:hypothetical protein pb186bvf_007044 [Paramecium bursaria]